MAIDRFNSQPRQVTSNRRIQLSPFLLLLLEQGHQPLHLHIKGLGDLALQIPKLRSGSFLPSILEPRRRVDQALYAVIMEAYIGGVSTRRGDAPSSTKNKSKERDPEMHQICKGKQWYFGM